MTVDKVVRSILWTLMIIGMMGFVFGSPLVPFKVLMPLIYN